jgi:TRAP-type C4-dicarboxylate transport system permease small subunit
MTIISQPETQKLPRMFIVEWISIIGVFLACFLFLLSEMKHIETKIDQQSARTDRLYEMFIDLLKEKGKT